MRVQLKDGVTFCVSDSLETISTWSALEQEDWFEKELDFVRRVCQPHWQVLDIGANHGIYSLALAKAGAAHIWAFEPISEPANRFRESISLNGFEGKITLVQSALSDTPRQDKFFLGRHLELSSATQNASSRGGEAYEVVDFVSLDEMACRLALPPIDFMKLDAEGEELSILEGGARFFAEHSPLVQFEYMERAKVNPELVKAFRALGYGIYVLVPGLMSLRFVEEGEEHQLDPFALNLFACKPDRAEVLAASGVLFSQWPQQLDIPEPSVLGKLLLLGYVDDAHRASWQAYASDSAYGSAIRLWSGSKDDARSPADRYAMLMAAHRHLLKAVEEEDFHPAVTMLLTRILADLGLQSHALMTSKALIDQIGPEDVLTDRPVPPVCAVFDRREPRQSLSGFLFESALEYFLASRAHIGLFAKGDENFFEAAMRSPERTAELERRLVLEVTSGAALDAGRGLRWLFGELENPNREIWLDLASQNGFYPFVDGVSADALIQEGDQSLGREDYPAAYRAYRQAMDQSPASADARFKVGVALMRLKRHQEAVDCFRAVLRMRPGHWQACNNLGLVLVELRDFGGAEGAYRSGIAENIDIFDLHYNLASLLKDTGRFAEALYYLRQAERLRPEMACVPDKIGSLLILLSRTNEAIPALERALKLEPDWAQAWNNLGRCHFIRGALDEADRCYKEAVTHAPEFLPAWTNRVMTMNYRSHDLDEVFSLHRAYGEKAREVAGPVDRARWNVLPTAKRRLRIGFVSGDFRRHSVSYFIEGVLRHLDRGRFQLYAYFSHDHPDQRTLEFKPLFNLWRDVKHLSDAELAERIAKDRIDILVDLIGHTTGTRLAVFAEKPAPVQLTWIGYPNTTGLDSMDYRITDEIVDPPGFADDHCTERLWRLPRPFLCYTPPSHAPAIGECPVFSNGCVTFGSFNSRFKIGDETLALWSNVLHACPASRMIIKSPVGLADEEAREELMRRFVAHGIEKERVEIHEGIGDPTEHLALYNSIDIALDPYPYHGTTTTFEAMWMGVPVVTQAGVAHVSRVGASILTFVGLPELVAATPEDYVHIARELAESPSRLVELRATLRARLQASALLDAKGMAIELGLAFETMWSDFCDSAEAHELAQMERKVTTEAPIRLNIGGKNSRPGWKNLDIQPAPHVDYVCDVRDLSGFEEESCSEIYCSHVLEHLGQGDILPVLENLHRMLVPGGRLSISVPDLDTLSWLIVSPQYPKSAKFEVMRCLFGGQSDEFDFHHIGLNLDFLCDYLKGVGFTAINHVESLDGAFEDASENAKFNGIPVSLNLVAIK